MFSGCRDPKLKDLMMTAGSLQLFTHAVMLWVMDSAMFVGVPIFANHFSSIVICSCLKEVADGEGQEKT
jgi:hypothetical protein